MREITRLRAERLARSLGPDATEEAMREVLAGDWLSQDPDEIQRVIDHARTCQQDPAFAGVRIDPGSYVMTQTIEAPAPSTNGTGEKAPEQLERIPRSRFDEVRERLRAMRVADPKLTGDAARTALEEEFGGTLSPTGFWATFWMKADPNDAEEEAAEEDVDDSEEIEGEELEVAHEAELQMILDEGGLRVVFDKVMAPQRAYAVVSAIAQELALANGNA